MIIDAHAHVDEVPGLDWIDPPDRLIDLMDRAHVDQACVMTYTEAPQYNERALEYVAESVARFPTRLIGFARLHPWYPQAHDLLEYAVVELGMRGLKLHPVGTLAHPASSQSIDLIRHAAGLRIPVLFHCGDEPMTTPLAIERAAQLVPEATIILGHMGGYYHVDEAIGVAKRRPNVYLETSAMPYPQKIRDAVRVVGAERVLFASDGPGCRPRLEVEKVRLAGLDPQDEASVLSSNIEHLLGRFSE
jgi:predicted TIM-barrel fold metal-dependent hydrolase